MFLNNDVRATAHTHPGWLAAMAGLARREPIGAVGACLLDPQGRLQHAVRKARSVSMGLRQLRYEISVAR